MQEGPSGALSWGGARELPSMKPLELSDDRVPWLEGGGHTAAPLMDLVCCASLSALGFHLAGGLEGLRSPNEGCRAGQRCGRWTMGRSSALRSRAGSVPMAEPQKSFGQHEGQPGLCHSG